MADIEWMKQPCGLCPFSRTNTLNLHPERAEEFAYMAENPYNDFVCHKTAECDDESGGYYRAPKSLTCNGFLSLQISTNGNAPEGFEPHRDAFEDAYEMIEAHEELWEPTQ